MSPGRDTRTFYQDHPKALRAGRTLNVEHRMMKSLSAVVAIGYYPAFAAASAEYAGEVCSLRQFINWQNTLFKIRRWTFDVRRSSFNILVRRLGWGTTRSEACAKPNKMTHSPFFFNRLLSTHKTGGILWSSCNRPKTLNIECRTRNRRITKGVTSTFDIPCSIFCGSEKILIKPIVAILPLCQVCPKVSFFKGGQGGFLK